MPRRNRAFGELTERQAQIALLYAAGFARTYIASSLCVEEVTVDASIARTYVDLGINRKAQLCKIMVETEVNAHRQYCADCQGRFICLTYETLRSKIKHYQRVESAA